MQGLTYRYKTQFTNPLSPEVTTGFGSLSQ